MYTLHGFTRCFGLCDILIDYLLPDDGDIFQSEMVWQFQKNGLATLYHFRYTWYSHDKS